MKRAFIGLFFFTAALAAQTPQSMDDPLFAIRYDPQTVKFENLPASLLKQCKNDLEGRTKELGSTGTQRLPMLNTSSSRG